MSDESQFPTAIVPARPLSSTQEKFDKLAQRFGDPMAKLFVLQQCGNPDLEFKAAAELLPYRHPRLKQSELAVNAQGAGQVNIQINIGGPPPAPSAAAEPVAVTPDPLT
jgi:hypothetical protein